MLISELPNATPQKTDKMELQRGLTSSNNTEIGQLMQLSASENLAPAYDPNAGTYEAGDFVSYDGTLYQCNTAIATPEAFDATKWDAVKVTEISSGASVIQLTQAEYTALSTAEKMNGSIYKITDNAKMYCLDEEYHPVKELTTAQYEALTSAERNNGTIYIQTDAETTADDVEYTSGVSVADKLDSLDFEEGTSGFFKYRKWNDGTLEIWGTRHATMWTPSWNAWGGGYYTIISSMGTYPVAFIDNPNVQVTFQPKGGQAFAGLTDGNYSNILTQAPIVGVYRFTSDSGSLNEFVLGIYATGRWKA